MKRAESVAVIYLSLLVCLALGQGTEGRGALTHVATYVEAGHWGHWGAFAFPGTYQALHHSHPAGLSPLFLETLTFTPPPPPPPLEEISNSTH